MGWVIPQSASLVDQALDHSQLHLVHNVHNQVSRRSCRYLDASVMSSGSRTNSPIKDENQSTGVHKYRRVWGQGFIIPFISLWNHFDNACSMSTALYPDQPERIQHRFGLSNTEQIPYYLKSDLKNGYLMDDHITWRCSVRFSPLWWSLWEAWIHKISL